MKKLRGVSIVKSVFTLFTLEVLSQAKVVLENFFGQNSTSSKIAEMLRLLDMVFINLFCTCLCFIKACKCMYNLSVYLHQ